MVLGYLLDFKKHDLLLEVALFLLKKRPHLKKGG
jgi:hypothetical protein